MKKRQLHHFGRIRRQINHLRSRINAILKNGSGTELLAVLYRKLRYKLGLLPVRYNSKPLLAGAVAGAVMLAPGVALGQTFDTPQTNPFGFTADTLGAFGQPTFADIDDDGDQDLFIMSFYGNLDYYANTSATAASFQPSVSNAFGLQSANNRTIGISNFGDINNDNKLDVLSISEHPVNDTTVLYLHLNTGTITNPAFAPPVELGLPTSALGGGTGQINNINSIRLADMDDDGDMDLVALADNAAGLHYYENVGTATTYSFAAPVAAPWGFQSPFPDNYGMLEVADFDCDGDMDLLLGLYRINLGSYDAELVYYENTGTATSPQLGFRQIAPTGLATPPSERIYYIAPAAVDLDDDGDLDIFTSQIGASQTGVYITSYYYYRNTTNCTIGLGELTTGETAVYPNPFEEGFTLELPADMLLTDVLIQVFDLRGQLVWQQSPVTSKLEVRLENEPHGIYLLKVQTGSGVFNTKLLKQ